MPRLMPWLAGTALLHSAVVMEKRNALKVWTILLAILDLLAVAARHLPGALGRAHLVHAFATDPDARRLHPGHPDHLHRRQPGPLRLAGEPCCAQGGIFAPMSAARARWSSTTCFLTASCATVFVGTLYPARAGAVTGWIDPQTRQDLGRRALLQPDFRPAARAAAARRSVRPASLAWKRGDAAGGRASGSPSPSQVFLLVLAAGFGAGLDPQGGAVLAPPSAIGLALCR